MVELRHSREQAVISKRDAVKRLSIVLTSLTFYGGVGEIGGNKVLLEDRNARFLLDFGMSFN